MMKEEAEEVEVEVGDVVVSLVREGRGRKMFFGRE
jgi:hypothetical protein